MALSLNFLTKVKHPTSKEDLLALTALRLNDCNLSGNQRRERANSLVLFLDCNCTRNRSLIILSIASTSTEHCLLSHPCTFEPRIFTFLLSFFLTGEIPASLGNCVKLDWLNLASNELEGKCSVRATICLKFC